MQDITTYVDPFGKVWTDEEDGTLHVTFTDEDLERIAFLAAIRTDGMRTSNVPTQKLARNYDDHAIDRLGLMAEVAFARAFPVGQVRISTGVDAGHDFTIPSTGETVDVKATFGAEVLRFRKKGCRSDLAFLVVRVDDWTMKLVGWEFKSELLKPFSEKAASKLCSVEEFRWKVIGDEATG